MHLLSREDLAKLKANKRAYEHFKKYEKTLQAFAKSMADFARGYPELNEGSRVALVATLILQLDPSIYGLAPVWMNARELAEIYARAVVGHEGGS